MKVLFFFILFCSFTSFQDCSDKTVYANSSQTKDIKRFDIFTRIDGCPTYVEGDYKFFKLLRKNLKLSDLAKTQIFMLNYQFTITCDGKLEDIKSLGDSKANHWTNIVELIRGTEGKWLPAKKGDTSVNCIFFGKMYIDGSRY